MASWWQPCTDFRYETLNTDNHEASSDNDDSSSVADLYTKIDKDNAEETEDGEQDGSCGGAEGGLSSLGGSTIANSISYQLISEHGQCTSSDSLNPTEIDSENN